MEVYLQRVKTMENGQRARLPVCLGKKYHSLISLMLINDNSDFEHTTTKYDSEDVLGTLRFTTRQLDDASLKQSNFL